MTNTDQPGRRETVQAHDADRPRTATPDSPDSSSVVEFQRGDLAIGVGWMPGRKRVCVTVCRGSVVHTAAYCRSEQEAQRLIDALQELTAGLIPAGYLSPTREMVHPTRLRPLPPA